ncbi:hypothetical protein O59_004245 [Cellvibrio sp. BR]|nr:hypothetical protein O59_004245 [Cellvibrio sp. BR]
MAQSRWVAGEFTNPNRFKVGSLPEADYQAKEGEIRIHLEVPHF